MNPLDLLPLEYRLAAEIALIAIVASTFVGFSVHLIHTHDRTVADKAIAPYVAAIEKQKKEAAQELAAETEKTRAAEQRLNEFVSAQNTKDAEHEATVADLSRQLATRRLRDPAKARSGGGSGSAASASGSSANAGAASAAQGDGVLSEEASAILRRLMLEADQINDAYESCRAQLLNDRAAP